MPDSTQLKKTGKLFPWYDSWWLEHYVKSKRIIAENYPEKLIEFEKALNPFRTNLDFEVLRIPQVLSESDLSEIASLVDTFSFEQLEHHEFNKLGRTVVHNHAYFNQLHRRLTSQVSALVGEAVEPSYNFLSMYHQMGKCPVHLDAPTAKWTLDICIKQSRAWPIYISDTIPWPEKPPIDKNTWKDEVLTQNPFREFNIPRGDAIIFSGSSQWHYRKPLENKNNNDFCDVLFLHFMPKGYKELSDPDHWPRYFNLPNLPLCWDQPQDQAISLHTPF